MTLKRTFKGIAGQARIDGTKRKIFFPFFDTTYQVLFYLCAMIFVE